MYKIKTAELETVCGLTSRLPKNKGYEVAFAGRSNVGKSSLINVLMERKSLARTSSQPGKTQTINYYHVNKGENRKDFAPDVYLVDLPGYGYAVRSKEMKEGWGRLIEGYLENSPRLKAVFLLVDLRHDPSKDDVTMYEWILAKGMTPVIIATKADKLKKSEMKSHVERVRQVLHAGEDVRLCTFSAVTREGRDAVWDAILSFDKFAGDRV